MKAFLADRQNILKIKLLPSLGCSKMHCNNAKLINCRAMPMSQFYPCSLESEYAIFYFRNALLKIIWKLTDSVLDPYLFVLLYT